MRCDGRLEDEIGVEKVDDGKLHYPASRHDTKRRHEQGNLRVYICCAEQDLNGEL